MPDLELKCRCARSPMKTCQNLNDVEGLSLICAKSYLESTSSLPFTKYDPPHIVENDKVSHPNGSTSTKLKAGNTLSPDSYTAPVAAANVLLLVVFAEIKGQWVLWCSYAVCNDVKLN